MVTKISPVTQSGYLSRALSALATIETLLALLPPVLEL
jgi:hypothetical protein